MYVGNFIGDERELFLELCIHAAHANKVLENSEKSLIDEYASEMKINDVYYNPKMELSDVLKKIKEVSSMKTRKMMFSEILSILIVDGSLDDDEKNFSEKVGRELEISFEDVNSISDLCKSIMNAYNGLNKIISE